jgi:hypothetical protein
MSARPEPASARLGLATRPADPESLEGWQSVVDQHGMALARLALAAPQPAREERPPADAPGPDATRPVPVRPGPASAAPPPPTPSAACESVTVRKRTTGTYRRHDGSATRPLTRCERACLHVNAICYASQRICGIADRLGDAAARGSCAGARQRCLDAREVARRAGCGCG